MGRSLCKGNALLRISYERNVFLFFIISKDESCTLNSLVVRLTLSQAMFANSSAYTDSILWSHHQETRELPGERDDARDNARCTQARKTTHGLDGQHQDVDRTLRGRVSQNDRAQR